MKKILITSLFLSLLGIILIYSRQQEDILDVLIPQEEVTPGHSQAKTDTLSYSQPMYPSVIH
ncbi:MAG: hypothetical protein KTR30_29525 [Saprospiraceae bacterium]|nr:hypothetical protein [Saprospiraceae bacterium]